MARFADGTSPHIHMECEVVLGLGIVFVYETCKCIGLGSSLSQSLFCGHLPYCCCDFCSLWFNSLVKGTVHPSRPQGSLGLFRPLEFLIIGYRFENFLYTFLRDANLLE